MPLPFRTIVYADDLTGALEMGVLARTSGRSVRVLRHPKPRRAAEIDTSIVVADLGTRELNAVQARKALYRHSPFWQGENPVAILKKTDSLLRGNVAVELDFLSAAYPQRRMVFVPAYPLMGRTVRNGVLYDSSQTGEPMCVADVGGVLRENAQSLKIRNAHSAAELRTALDETERSLILCDGERQDEVEAIGRELAGCLDRTVVCGPAGVFRGLFAAMGGTTPSPQPVPPLGTGVAFIGSVHPISNRQVLKLRKDAAVVVLPNQSCLVPSGAAAAWTEVAGSARWLLVAPFEEAPGDSGSEWTIRIGGPLKSIFSSGSPPRAMLLSGGETASLCLETLGIGILEPIREVLPGVVLGRAQWRDQTLWIATKSGAFGNPDTLVEVVRMLRHGSSQAETR